MHSPREDVERARPAAPMLEEDGTLGPSEDVPEHQGGNHCVVEWPEDRNEFRDEIDR